MASKRWTAQEDSLVKELYGKVQAREIAERMGTGRTEEAVRIRAKTLNINGDRPERWTKKEETLMLEKYEALGPTEMHTLIPNKSIVAITGKARLMGLKCRETRMWTQEEEQFMLDNYISIPNRLIEEILDRSENSVQRKAEEMGLAHTKVPSEFELYIESLLRELGVSYEREVKVGNFICDFVIEGTKVIETYGDYWHCNPEVYPQGPKFSSQHSQIERDKRRASYLKEMGYQLLIIWEKDALLNKEKVVNGISTFLNVQSVSNPNAIYCWVRDARNFLTYTLYSYIKDSIEQPIFINRRVKHMLADLTIGNSLLILRERHETLSEYELSTNNIKPSKLNNVKNYEDKIKIFKALGYQVIEISMQELSLNPQSALSRLDNLLDTI